MSFTIERFRWQRNSAYLPRLSSDPLKLNFGTKFFQTGDNITAHTNFFLIIVSSAISDIIARVTESGLVTLTKADPLTTMLYAITSLSVPLYLYLRLQEQQFPTLSPLTSVHIRTHTGSWLTCPC